MNINFEDTKNLADNMGLLLGKDCEIVVHDFTGEVERTVVHIVNNELSGRSAGDCPSNLMMEQMASYTPDKGRHVQYYATTDDGRTIRSSNTMLTGTDGAFTGVIISINMYITKLAAARGVLDGFVGSVADDAQKLLELSLRAYQVGRNAVEG